MKKGSDGPPSLYHLSYARHSSRASGSGGAFQIRFGYMLLQMGQRELDLVDQH